LKNIFIDFKNLSERKRGKYEKQYEENCREYQQKIDKFYLEHPDLKPEAKPELKPVKPADQTPTKTPVS
jgi:hypothetical protein